MKKHILMLVSFCMCFTAFAQDITQYQYWYDSDYGTSVIQNVTPNSVLDLNTALSGTSNLSGGTHSVNFRAKDSNGKWSTTMTEQFFNSGNSNIVSYEYWFDDNYGAIITNAVSPTQSYILASNFNTSAVGYGMHTLNFRALDFSGKWSIVMKEYFYKSVAGSEFSNAEYWIDSDFANKQTVAFTSSNIVLIDQSLLTANLDDKLHTFNFRMQDQAGKWSIVTSSHFMVNSLIVGYEYWFDTNYSNKTSVNVAPTSLLQNQSDFVANGLSGGLHVVNFRAKNNFGKYSSAIFQNITVIVTPTFTQIAPVCIGSVISPLPTTSTNNIIGTWSPALNSSATTTYTFTPNAGQFSVSTTMTIESYIDTPTFNPVASIGIGGSLAALPLTSLNGYTGTWSPALNNMMTTTYTFTPTVGLCATTTTLEIEVNPNFTFYADADNDGYGNPLVSQLVPIQPVGYVLNDDDCNDTQPTVYQGAIEIAFDGLDNNCDGVIDEGNQITTQLTAAACNSSLPVINSTIYAIPKANVTGYRFEVTNLTTNAVQVLDKPLQFFSLTQLSNYDYATNYSIRVMLKKGTTWLGYYGTPCLVTSPGIGSPTQSSVSIVSPTCGSTIAINSTLYTTPLTGVTGYRFRVSTPGQTTYILDRNLQFFAFNSLPTYVYGAVYTVEVAVKTTGAYTPYGPACTFTTTTPSIAAVSCGATIVAGGVIYATPLANATSYIFSIFDYSTATALTPIVRTNQILPVNLIPGYSSSKQYLINVSVVTTGQQSSDGISCNINPTAEARNIEQKLTNDLAAVGSPNPFETNFELKIDSTSTDRLTITLYDMIGKQLEVIEVTTTDAVSLGANYPAGVYSVVVSQGSELKTLRMIKR